MGWLIALGILILLALLPLGLGLRYQEGKFSFKVRVAGIPIPIDFMELATQEKKPKKQKEKPRPEDQPTNPNAPKKKKKLDLQKIMPLLKLALEMLGDLKRKLRVDHLELKLILADGDPCDLAIAYGNTWAAVANLMASLENALVIRHRDIDIQCDFTSDKTLAAGRLDLHLTLGRMVGLVAVYGCKALGMLMKNRKGGA